MLTVCIIAIALVIVGRLYVLQMMRGGSYASKADAQFVAPPSPLLDRGSIYFTDKDNAQIVAATLKDGFSLAVNPSKVTNVEQLYAALKNIIPQTHDEFVAKATKQGSQYQLLAQHLDSSIGVALEKQQLAGLTISQDRWRLYPGDSLAAQELGFVAYNGDGQEGRYGLERQYNETLERNDSDLYANFFVELFGGVQSLIQGDPQQGDVITTIEPSVQAELERQLVAYDQQWHPKLAGGIIMNPQDGEV